PGASRRSRPSARRVQLRRPPVGVNTTLRVVSRLASRVSTLAAAGKRSRVGSGCRPGTPLAPAVRVRRTRGLWWWSWLMAAGVVRCVGAADEVGGPSYGDGGAGRGREVPSPPIEVRRIELWREPVPTLRVHTSRALRPTVTSVAADGASPARLVVDLPAPV